MKNTCTGGLNAIRTPRVSLRPRGDEKLHSHRCNSSQSAFTLMELMVVIVLIGIASVMIIPEMKGSYEDAVLRASCRELVDTFQLAYSRAVSLNQDHRVRIDLRSGRYVIEASQAGASRTQFQPLKGVTGCEGKLDSRIRVHVRPPDESSEEPASFAGRNREELPEAGDLIFHADGTATSGHVVLADQHGFELDMTVNPVTGRVSIGEARRK